MGKKSANSCSRVVAGTTIRSFLKPGSKTSTAPKLKATDNQSYGYLWWLGRARLNERKVVHWIGALGRGGQYIRIVPELDLVVAVTAGYYQDYSPQAFRLQFAVFQDVLGAVPLG